MKVMLVTGKGDFKFGLPKVNMKSCGMDWWF